MTAKQFKALERKVELHSREIACLKAALPRNRGKAPNELLHEDRLEQKHDTCNRVVSDVLEECRKGGR